MYKYEGVDAVGNSICDGDKVVYFREKSGIKVRGASLGDVFLVCGVEHSGYIGRATVLVHHDGDTTWLCHEDLMVI